MSTGRRGIGSWRRVKAQWNKDRHPIHPALLISIYDRYNLCRNRLRLTHSEASESAILLWLEKNGG